METDYNALPENIKAALVLQIQNHLSAINVTHPEVAWEINSYANGGWANGITVSGRCKPFDPVALLDEDYYNAPVKLRFSTRGTVEFLGGPDETMDHHWTDIGFTQQFLRKVLAQDADQYLTEKYKQFREQHEQSKKAE